MWNRSFVADTTRGHINARQVRDLATQHHRHEDSGWDELHVREYDQREARHSGIEGRIDMCGSDPWLLEYWNHS
jgi:hypothetical protein